MISIVILKLISCQSAQIKSNILDFRICITEISLANAANEKLLSRILFFCRFQLFIYLLFTQPTNLRFRWILVLRLLAVSDNIQPWHHGERIWSERWTNPNFFKKMVHFEEKQKILNFFIIWNYLLIIGNSILVHTYGGNDITYYMYLILNGHWNITSLLSDNMDKE